VSPRRRRRARDPDEDLLRELRHVVAIADPVPPPALAAARRVLTAPGRSPSGDPHAKSARSGNDV
jgi:hypothetical protein